MTVHLRAACAGAVVCAQQLLGRVQQATTDDTALTCLISGGCCGDTNPVLCRRDAVLEGFDVALGEAGGLPVFGHPGHARYLTQNHSHGGRFILRELGAR